MSDYEIIGPFDTYRVVVGGRRVPYLDATPMNGGIISLTLDSRFALDVPVADAGQVIPFIADCIAVGPGLHVPPSCGHGACEVNAVPATARRQPRPGTVISRD